MSPQQAYHLTLKSEIQALYNDPLMMKVFDEIRAATRQQQFSITIYADQNIREKLEKLQYIVGPDYERRMDVYMDVSWAKLSLYDQNVKACNQIFTEFEYNFARLCNLTAITTVEAWKSVLSPYGDPGRYYHNYSHLLEMLQYIKSECPDVIPDYLFLAAIFHDVVYDHNSDDNEMNSLRKMEMIFPDGENYESSEDTLLKYKYDVAAQYIIGSEDHGERYTTSIKRNDELKFYYKIFLRADLCSFTTNKKAIQAFQNLAKENEYAFRQKSINHLIKFSESTMGKLMPPEWIENINSEISYIKSLK